jgi:NAD(P)-dependent dehydrogenase (short-subunit alcohol dehydrogenase family)
MRDLEGKVCLVTGASSGIGKVTAEALAKRGARVWLACRDEAKTQPVLRAIAEAGGDASFVELNLSDLRSVEDCARVVLARPEPLHVLLNNAGQAGKVGLTAQGFELAFGVNHLAHFALTQRLLPRLLEQTHARVVNVASLAHYNVSGVDFGRLRSAGNVFTVLRQYGVSKLCNVLHAKELARRYGSQGLHAYALHPGVIASDVWRQVPQPFRWWMKRSMISNEAGARTSLYCATSAEVAGDNGLYYDDCRIKEPSPAAQSAELARELWERSERFLDG